MTSLPPRTRGLAQGCGRRRYDTEEQARRNLPEGQDAYECWRGGHWHRKPAAQPTTPASGPLSPVSPRRQRAQRDTGPDEATRLAVLERDGYVCVCCAVSVIGRRYSIQHRDGRGMGGTSRPEANAMSNLLTMLGSGTTDCHGRVEAHRNPLDGIRGYRLKTGQVPSQTPLLLVRERPRWVLALDDGTYADTDPPEGYSDGF